MEFAIEPKKPRFPAEVARAVAAELVGALQGECERIQVAGSLRRGKPTVGDIEILYIGRREVRPVPGDMFATAPVNQADAAIDRLIADGVLAKRTNVNGSTMYGEKNKLLRHVRTGLPLDLFAATEENWYNYLVCRTGPAESNIRIANHARAYGLQWHPYGAGFEVCGIFHQGGKRLDFGTIIRMESEEQVFQFVRLPYRPPEQRR